MKFLHTRVMACLAICICSIALPCRGAVSENSLGSGLKLSAILDTYWHHDDSPGGISDLIHEIDGFGHTHSLNSDHHHAEVANGFNLNHLELCVSASIDPTFRASAIAAITEDGAELEEAVIDTSALPGGWALRIGKFRSDFGRINARHLHEQDFTQLPLIHQLLLGDHGLAEPGAQASWLAPTPFYLLGGIELFQGTNEALTPHIGSSPLPDHDGPRTTVAWLKFGPSMTGLNSFQMGLSWLNSQRQEAHDGDDNGVEDHWFDGDVGLIGFDLTWKHDSTQANGQGDVVIQTEYLKRHNKLTVVRHDLNAALNAQTKEEHQDGLYVQATWGFAPRWRVGARWDQVGLENENQLPDGTSSEPASSSRTSLMTDFSPSEFSRIRLGWSGGKYHTASGTETANELNLQLQVALGAHGAHSY